METIDQKKGQRPDRIPVNLKPSPVFILLKKKTLFKSSGDEGPILSHKEGNQVGHCPLAEEMETCVKKIKALGLG
jgi:hypothetical protein